MHRIYLDHNATCPPCPAALAVVREVGAGAWANPHSPHREGREARAVLEEARARVARLAGTPASHVIFTSGGTEAAHTALAGLARADGGGRRNGVVISGLEHASLAAAAHGLAREGFRVLVVRPRGDGTVETGRFLEACGPDTAVAALIAAHNELGTLQPVEEVAMVLAERNIPLVVDAVQLPGRHPVRLPSGEHVVGLLSAHKFGGLPGAGAVIAAPDRALVPLLGGGEQERGRRAGTPALALIAAMGVAAKGLERGNAGIQRMAALRDRFEQDLLVALPQMQVIGRGAARLPNTSAFRVPGVRGEDLVAALDLGGIAASTGSACSTGSARPSAALLAMGFSDAQAREMVRVSLGPETRASEITTAVAATAAAARRQLAQVAAAGVGS